MHAFKLHKIFPNETLLVSVLHLSVTLIVFEECSIKKLILRLVENFEWIC
jgi:hypothetical protein